MGEISLLDLSDTREEEEEGEGLRHRREPSRRGPLKQSPDRAVDFPPHEVIPGGTTSFRAVKPFGVGNGGVQHAPR